jgi:hypothetical protein
MLKWKMKDIVGVIKNIFTGAGQIIPTITQQYAKKAKVDERWSDHRGRWYVSTGSSIVATHTIVWEQRIASRGGALTCMLSWHLSTITVMYHSQHIDAFIAG